MIANSVTPSGLRAGFVLEQTLGHVTHAQNLKRLLAGEASLAPRWIDVPFRPGGRPYRLPPFSLNWSLRGSLYARRALAEQSRQMDCVFMHTMTIALFAAPVFRHLPAVLSIDATPENIDSLAAGYSHKRQPPLLESIKRAWIRSSVRGASAYVSWSEWAKRSLVESYGIAPERVAVIPPGTDPGIFKKASVRRPGPPRILFVGGDFLRKGGDVLLQAYRERLRGKAELQLVTGFPVEEEEGVRVYDGLAANSAPLLDLFNNADIFALPTRADCLAVVLGEAMAASLPVVTTTVGAHGEAVEDGVNGFTVPVDDAGALAETLERLVEDRVLCAGMGRQARAIAEERFDARRNALKVVELLQIAAGGGSCAGL